MSETPARKRRRRRPHASEITPDTPIWCPTCQTERPAAEFPTNRSKYSGLQSECKKCVTARITSPEGRAYHRERNRERWKDPEYRRKSNEWRRARWDRLGTTRDLTRSRRRLQAIVDEWKATGCIDCGYSDIRALDCDHVDPSEKEENVHRMVQLTVSEARLRAELAKCVVRCHRCHREHTRLQRQSGLRWAPKLPPSWRRVFDQQDRNDAIKLKAGCTDCSWAEWPRGLDWDHVRPGKTKSISQLIAHGRPWEEIEAEMALCEVVCANCHRIRSHERRQAAVPKQRQRPTSP